LKGSNKRDIIQNQRNKISNLVTHSGRFNILDYQKALVDMHKAYKDYPVGGVLSI
jgi:hypothetical protein